MDDFIARELFEPLGIKEFHWFLDRAGNPSAMAGLRIRAIDLAKIGQMMLDEGAWKGRQILSKEWVRKSVEPSQSFDPTCGLLWWLIDSGPMRFAIDDGVVKHFKDRGASARSIEKLESVKGKPMDGEGCWAALRSVISATRLSAARSWS